MSCLKAVFFALLVAVVFSSLSFASVVPVHADEGDEFDISAAGLVFLPLPWISPSAANTVAVVPYTVNDYTPELSGKVKQNSLGYGTLNNGGFNFYAGTPAGGDLAIKYINSSGADRLFEETVLTINFEPDREPLDVYLPEFELASGDEMHFWVGSDGSTYYANSTGVPGSAAGLNMTAAESIEAGDVAAIPEPVSLALLGLGGLFFFRRRAG